MSDRGEWLARIASIRQWSRAGERAPHKPLLLLYAFGRLHRTGESAVSYGDAEPDLQRLLADYGPPRATSPAYPFHYLQSDGLWTVDSPEGDPGASAGRLRSSGAVGSLVPELEEALRRDPGLLVLGTRLLLDANFPESLRTELCEAVGLDVDSLEIGMAKTRASQLRRRDPQFRERVLVAYEFQCAMCGYDGRLATEAVGLDAAHLQWWVFHGPDTIDNALCLCSFHHKLLDRGVLGVTPGCRVAVSNRFVGRGRAAEELVLCLVDQPLLEPQPGLPHPGAGHIAWHTEQVFRAPARVAAR